MIKIMIKTIFENKLLSFGLITLASITALSAALIGEHVFGLQPCNLCVYQRYPFAIGIILGLIGMLLSQKATISRIILAVLSLNFLANSVIAFYHSGVEQKWWKSIFEACIVPMMDKDKNLLDNIMGTPLTSCTDIQWVDPILGLSMANYNIVFCFGLFVFCLLSIFFKNPPPPSMPA